MERVFDRRQVVSKVNIIKNKCREERELENELRGLEDSLKRWREASDRSEFSESIGGILYRPRPSLWGFFLLVYGIMMGGGAISLIVNLFTKPVEDGDSIPIPALIFIVLLLGVIAYFAIRGGLSLAIDSIRNWIKETKSYGKELEKEMATIRREKEESKTEIPRYERLIEEKKLAISAKHREYDKLFDELGVREEHRHEQSAIYLWQILNLNNSSCDIDSYSKMNDRLNTEMGHRAAVAAEVAGNIANAFAESRARAADRYRAEQALDSINSIEKSLDEISRKLK